MKKTKKILSILLALSTVISSFVLPITVQAEALVADDYVPGAKNENMIVPDQESYARGFVNGTGSNGGNVSWDKSSGVWSDAAKTRAEVYLEATDTVTTNAVSGFSGAVYKNKDGSGNVIASRPVYDVNKSYVFSVKAKKMTDQETKLGLSLTNETGGTLSYSKEYGAEGLALTQEYQDFKVTFKPAAGFTSTKQNVLIIGLPAGTEKGAKAAVNTSAIDGVYLAEEQAYDITNTRVSDEETIVAGNTAEFKAEVLNQIGLSGYLKQNFTWYVMNEDKTAIADGITVATDESTQNATVTVSDDAVKGIYSVVAVSNDYGMVKTRKIQVLDKNYYQDYIPTGVNNDNLIAPDQDSRARGFVNGSGTNGGNVSVDKSSAGWSNAAKTRTEIYFEATDTVTTNAVSGFSGMVYKNRDGSGNVIASRPVYDVNKSYVFSIRAKKMTDQETKLGMSLTNEAGGSVSYTKEYGKDGITLTDEYVRYGMTIKPAAGFNKDKANVLVFGMPAGIEKGAKAALDTSELESVYLAEEKAYKITNTRISDKETFMEGDTAEFKAEVLNQVGVTGYLDQTFVWYAMNTNRTEFIDGITVTPSADTKSATVTVGKNVTSGEYAIVAVSDIYGMAKGCRITVVENTEECVSDFALEQIGNDAILEASVINTDSEFVNFYVAEYNGNLLKSVKLESIKAVNGKATGKAVLKGVESGNKIKAFVWTDSLYPIENENNTEITVKSVSQLYGEELEPGSYEALSVTDFYNNKTAAVSVTFDDGIYSAAEYYNSLFEKHNIHGTAMLVSDWVKTAEISKWQALFDGGYIDLANHSKSHSIKYATDSPTIAQLEEDITGGYDALKLMFPNEQILSFAAPWTQNTTASVSEIKKNHYANRNGGSGFIDANPTEDKLFNLPGFVVENKYTASELNAKIDAAITNGQWFIHLMHGVGTGTYNIDKDVCAEHFAYIGSKSDDVWAGSLNEVIKYIYERQNSQIQYNWVREKAISLSITDTLDDILFDFPLTVKVNVPSGWTRARVWANGEVSTVNVVAEGGKNYVYINAVPDKGEILLESN